MVALVLHWFCHSSMKQIYEIIHYNMVMYFDTNTSVSLAGVYMFLDYSLQIISKIEAIKRRSIVLEEPLPLPELNGQSTILDDALILQVILCSIMIKWQRPVV